MSLLFIEVFAGSFSTSTSGENQPRFPHCLAERSAV